MNYYLILLQYLQILLLFAKKIRIIYIIKPCLQYVLVRLNELDKLVVHSLHNHSTFSCHQETSLEI